MAMFKPFAFKITKDTLTPGLEKFFKKAGVTPGKMNKDKQSADFKARQAVGLQLINFAINGSSSEPVRVPIRFGILRGSGSVFVDGTFVGDTKGSYASGKPNKQYTPNEAGDVTVGFNTAYAARLHETDWVPGGAIPSKQSVRNPGILANVGNKFLEKHLKADGKVLTALYAAIFKREAGT